MKMRTHLGDDVLLDVLEGTAAAAAVRHAAACADCGRRVADARAAWSQAADAEAPAPSPLFWDAFPRRVASAIAVEPRPRRLGGFLAPAVLASAALVAVIAFLPRDPAPALAPSSLSASAALPAVEEPLVDAAAVSADELECRDVAACVAALSDEESRALADALRADLAGSDL
jgi:hypothetical protein